MIRISFIPTLDGRVEFRSYSGSTAETNGAAKVQSVPNRWARDEVTEYFLTQVH